MINKIAQIIPQKKLPRGMDYFDYIIPKNIKILPGQLVDIPFKKSTLKGLVYALKDKSDFPHVKELLGVDKDLGSLGPYLLPMVNWFSENYYYSKGSTLDLFLPAVLKRKVTIAEKLEPAEFAELKITDKVKDISQQILQKKNAKYLLFPFENKLKNQLYLELCKNIFKLDEQILILFPQVQKLKEFYKYLSKDLRQQTQIITADLNTSKARHLSAWQQVYKNEKKIIIGTRSAVFFSFSKLNTIVIDDVHSSDYKQWDQNPRYEVINFLQKLQSLVNCNLVLSSLTPRVEDVHLAKDQKYQMIKLGQFKKNKLQIVDLRQERQVQFTYLSNQLLEKLKTSKKALLIVNKLGEYSYFLCNDCGYEATCPHCQLPMSVDANYLKCHRCQTKMSIPLKCPKCQSVNLKKLGLGLEQIKKTLQNLLNKKVCDVKEQGYEQEADIYLTTGQNLAENIFANIDLLGFVYIDSLVHLADFNSNYKLYSFCQEIVQQSIGQNKNVKILLQTAFSDNLAFQALNLGYEEFYKNEIENRQMFGYPPFAKLIKIFYQHHDLAVSKKEAWRLFETIKNDILQVDGKITEPYLYYAQKVRQRYRWQIALFLPNISSQKENKLIALIPEYWTIDKNPLDLL